MMTSDVSTDLLVESRQQGAVHVDLCGVSCREGQGSDDEGPMEAAGLLHGSFKQQHAVLMGVALHQWRS